MKLWIGSKPLASNRFWPGVEPVAVSLTGGLFLFFGSHRIGGHGIRFGSLFFLEVVVFQGFLVHHVIYVLFPFVLGFTEFIDTFSERAKKLRYFLGSEKKEYDQKDKNDFSTAKVSDEGKRE